MVNYISPKTKYEKVRDEFDSNQKIKFVEISIRQKSTGHVTIDTVDIKTLLLVDTDWDLDWTPNRFFDSNGNFICNYNGSITPIEENKTVSESYCHPSSHVFNKKLLASNYYNECKYCLYSPEHDGDKQKYYQTHKDYMEWKKKRGF